jgi:hypothetical protein
MQSKPSEDEAAILKVIDADHQAFWRKDLEAIAALHVQARYARRWAWWLPDVLVIREAWSSIRERLGGCWRFRRCPMELCPLLPANI